MTMKVNLFNFREKIKSTYKQPEYRKKYLNDGNPESLNPSPISSVWIRKI